MTESKTFKPTARPRSCPWHHINSTHEIAPGIWSVSTESHGGILISAERRAAMPQHLRDIETFTGGNAYEEDCDWTIVALAFPDCFTPKQVDYAREHILGYDREPRDWEIGKAYYTTLKTAAQTIKRLECENPKPAAQLAIEFA